MTARKSPAGQTPGAGQTDAGSGYLLQVYHKTAQDARAPIRDLPTLATEAQRRAKQAGQAAAACAHAGDWLGANFWRRRAARHAAVLDAAQDGDRRPGKVGRNERDTS